MRIQYAQLIRHIRSWSRTESSNLDRLLILAASILPPPHAQQKAGKRFVIREQYYSLRGFSSASRMPSLTKSSGFGRCCSLCSRLSARMCFSRAFWFACNAGAVDVGARILPVKCVRTYLGHVICGPYARQAPHGPGASRGPFSGCL